MPTILSIQSHVAFGHVGNRAAVFPLERLGCETIAVNTVQFSNHTGYGQWTGAVFPAEHIAEVVRGVDERGALAGCDAALTGYVGDAGLGSAVLDAVARLKRANPAALWACDPVMGDDGRGFFVRPGLPEFFRDEAVPRADIVTPNRFELEYLADRRVETLDAALAATEAVRARGPGEVLVTSLTRRDGPPQTIGLLLDTGAGAWLVETPLLALDPAPNGAGDATAALFLARRLQGHDPAAALELAAGSIFAVFEATRAAGTRDLQLVAAQDALVVPPQRFAARQVR